MGELFGLLIIIMLLTYRDVHFVRIILNITFTMNINKIPNKFHNLNMRGRCGSYAYGHSKRCSRRGWDIIYAFVIIFKTRVQSLICILKRRQGNRNLIEIMQSMGRIDHWVENKSIRRRGVKRGSICRRSLWFKGRRRRNTGLPATTMTPSGKHLCKIKRKIWSSW